MFYTYLWLRHSGTPYYVGKGKENRAFIDHPRIGGRRVKCPILNQIIIQEWLSEDEAFEAEKFLIAYYGRIDIGTGCLRNLTDGGEGPSGMIVSEETRKKRSESLKGHPGAVFKHTQEARKKISEAGMGRIPPTRSIEWRKRQSESHKGQSRPCSEETRQRMSLSAVGNNKGHIRWHVRRGIVNLDCTWCSETICRNQTNSLKGGIPSTTVSTLMESCPI